MDPVTGLHHGDRERGGVVVKEMCAFVGGEEVGEEGGSFGTGRSTVTLILLHIVTITLLNMTQAGWHISSLQSNLLFGHRRVKQRGGEEGKTRLFWFNAFLDISLSEMTCCSPFNVSENTL